MVLYKSIGNAQPDLCVLSNGHIINYDLCKVLMCHFPQILKNYILSIDHINLCHPTVYFHRGGRGGGGTCEASKDSMKISCA